MGTRVRLDETRIELSELPYGCYRKSADIHPPQGGKRSVFQWPCTGSWTIQPINIIAEFAQYPGWDALKYRLSDVCFEPGWWSEIPMHHDTLGNGYDYFFNCQVPSALITKPSDGMPLDKLPQNSNFVESWAAPPSASRLIDGAIGTAQQLLDRPTAALVSKVDAPPNQGFMLRFRLHHSLGAHAAVLAFYWAQFILVLHSEGTANLWQTDNGRDYAWVKTFPWNDGGLTTREYSLIIFPHARNLVEFLSILGPGMGALPADIRSGYSRLYRAWCYERPDSVPVDQDGNCLITRGGPWGLRISRAFRPFVQVSRLGFFFDNNELYDVPVTFPVPPSLSVVCQPDGDNNGGASSITLVNPDDGTPYVSDGKHGACQFHITLRGTPDLPATTQEVSLTTPELFGYSLYKDAMFQTVARQGVELPVLSVSSDRGDAPESERATIAVDNSAGQAEAFRRRGDIPLSVVDSVTGLTLFEGTAQKVNAGVAPAQQARRLQFECTGMVDNLLRARWTLNAPNFGKDPEDDGGRGWPWQKAVCACFAACGFDPATQVVFDPVNGVDASRYNFRLWLDGGSGGTRDGAGAARGDGGKASYGQRWWPTPGAPVHEYLDYLIRSVLGWNWYWDRADHKWHIHKRPRPEEVAALTPLVGFYRSQAAAREAEARLGIPCYAHRSLAEETLRAEYTTIHAVAYSTPPPEPDKGWQWNWPSFDYMKPMSEVHSSDPAAGAAEPGPWLVPFENPNGFASPAHPNPVIGPDWLGRQRVRQVFLANCATWDAVEWIGRRIYEDNCFGYTFGTFMADWGDACTFNLHKWQPVMVDDELCLIDRVEPEWQRDEMRRARYRVSVARMDAPPPR